MYNACILVAWGIIGLATLGVSRLDSKASVLQVGKGGMAFGEKEERTATIATIQHVNRVIAEEDRHPVYGGGEELISQTLACAAGCSFPGVE